MTWRRPPDWALVALMMLAVAVLVFVAVVTLVPSGPDPTDHDAPPPWRALG